MYVFQCITKYVKEQKKCPQCSSEVNPEGEQMVWFEAILNTMFLDYAQVLAETKLAGIPGSEAITVATMNGDTAWIPYKRDMTIAALKRHVRDELNIAESKQKLLYNEQALKVEPLFLIFIRGTYNNASNVLNMCIIMVKGWRETVKKFSHTKSLSYRMKLQDKIKDVYILCFEF